MQIQPTIHPTVAEAPPAPDRNQQLMTQAKALEASFLAEMLGQAGLGAPSEEFGGGPGEEQFASFLRQEQARVMVEKGGIGLAEMIFRSLSERDNAAP